MKNEVKYFEYDGEYFVARDKESCIQLISECNGEKQEDIAGALIEVSKDVEIHKFFIENLESFGFNSSTYAEIHNVSLEEIYKIIYKSEEEIELPFQLVYQD